MEAGDPRFPEYPGWGLSASRVPSLPAPNPPPHASNFFLRPCPPRGHRTERRPERPGGPSPTPHPGHAPGDPTSAPEFPTRHLTSARWGKGCLEAGAGRAPWGVWVGTGAQVSASGAAGVPAARQRQGSRDGSGALEGSGHSRGARLLPRSPPGCGSGRCAEAAEQLQPPPPRRSKLAPCAMVTHSKFPAAGMSRPLDTSLRLKTFSSKSEYQLVVNAVRKLQESGFYWSTVTGGEANLLLSAEPAGTFLIRDSSDQRHFFTLSVKTQSGTKNLRIQCEGGSFSLQSDPRSTQPVPRFDCVLKLVHHYMPAAGAPSFSQPPAEPSSSPSSEVPEQPPAQPLSGNPPRRAYYIYSGGEKIPLVLSRPLSSNVATLQHLCRKTVNGHLDSYEKVTQLPGPIREFLDQYDAPL
uniref:Suppressor of cytokine signaling 3 n=1 Tax=Bos mutus grunniens TaxID=30521 RepID=A0A8B9XTM1_BOSMU